ncbi:hypothetical protein BN970_01347 [Mycolicibacterium conceptionense]|uniref:Uncharacterized protein n=1 Tax=Mycolicibacterium conceptionense TaxID=451644 RepID=A0A0U1D5H1_9MYCO|nr:hypothetical protein [Mycolicibacterium conceptionense]CQD07179.1 hypothetical protein BN970_01347 [Mycolicibacterium conceptionense]
MPSPKPMRSLYRRMHSASEHLRFARDIGDRELVAFWSAKMDGLLDLMLEERAKPVAALQKT